MSTEHELFGELHEQEEYGLFGNEHRRQLLEEFIYWARDCGEDAFYIFEETDEAIKKFFEQRDE